MRTASNGSDRYGTSVINEEESLLLLEVCLEHNEKVEDAISDMRMIDNLLYMQRLYTVLGYAVRRTRAGHLRKGSGLYEALDSIIDGRVKNLM